MPAGPTNHPLRHAVFISLPRNGSVTPVVQLAVQCGPWVTAFRPSGGEEHLYLSTVDRPTAADVGTASPSRRRLTTVSGNVLALGTVSLITDVSSEMVTAVLPLYLVLGLQLSPLAYGVVDGVYTGATAILRVAGGYLAQLTNLGSSSPSTGWVRASAPHRATRSSPCPHRRSGWAGRSACTA